MFPTAKYIPEYSSLLMLIFGKGWLKKIDSNTNLNFYSQNKYLFSVGKEIS